MVNDARPGPNFIRKKAMIDSNLNFQAWRQYSHIFSPLDPALLDQLMWGFPVGVTDPTTLSVPYTNHASARNNPQVVEEYILKHLDTKAIYGPFDCNPLDVPIIVSPLQVAFSSSGKARVCNDLSYGQVSVNSQISDDWSTYPGYEGDLQLPTIDDAVEAILECGPGCLLYKTDYSSYYKQLNTDPGDIPLLGFAYAGKVFFEARLPFGLRSSCLNAQRVTSAVINIFHHYSPSFLAGYIDDCLGVSLSVRAHQDYHIFITINNEVRLLCTLPKCVAPCTCLIWIGLELDTLLMQMRLPRDKRERIIAFLQGWLERKCATKRDLQSLLGVLNHAASAIICGRAFTGHIIDVIRQDSFPIDLPQELFKDVNIWLELLQSEVADGMAFKSPKTIPVDYLVELAVFDNLIAVRVQENLEVFEISDNIDFPPEYPTFTLSG